MVPRPTAPRPVVPRLVVPRPFIPRPATPTPAAFGVELAVAVVEVAELDEEGENEEVAVAPELFEELMTPELLTELHGTDVVLRAESAGHRAHHGTRSQVHSDAVERRQCGHNRTSRGARGQIRAPGIGHCCALRTAGGVAETRPERRGCPDAAWHRRGGLRCTLTDAKRSDGKYHGCRVERLHLHDRMPGSVGQRSQLSAICSTLDAGAGAARRSDNSTKHPDVNRRSRFITPPNRVAHRFSHCQIPTPDLPARRGSRAMKAQCMESMD